MQSGPIDGDQLAADSGETSSMTGQSASVSSQNPSTHAARRGGNSDGAAAISHEAVETSRGS